MINRRLPGAALPRLSARRHVPSAAALVIALPSSLPMWGVGGGNGPHGAGIAPASP